MLASQLNELCEKEGATNWTELTKDWHFYPDLHGNRSPIADPRMRGSITGLALVRPSSHHPHTDADRHRRTTGCTTSRGSTT